MRLSRTTLAALAAAALVVGGCGGDGSGGGMYGGGGGDGQEAGPTAADEETAEDEATDEETDEQTDEQTDDEAAGGEELVITISDFSYDVPDSIEPGAEVTVRNEDSVGHTVTADDGEAFDVPVGPGEEATFAVPEEEGDYPFHCTPHPEMTETLTVGG